MLNSARKTVLTFQEQGVGRVRSVHGTMVLDPRSHRDMAKLPGGSKDQVSRMQEFPADCKTNGCVSPKWCPLPYAIMPGIMLRCKASLPPARRSLQS